MLISLDLWQTGSKFQRQIWVFYHSQLDIGLYKQFRQWPTSGNENMKLARRGTKSPICRWNFDAVCHSFKYFRFRGLFPAVGRWCNGLWILSCISLIVVENPGLPLNFDDIYHTFGYISTSGFVALLLFLIVIRRQSHFLWTCHGRFSKVCSWKTTHI